MVPVPFSVVPRNTINADRNLPCPMLMTQNIGSFASHLFPRAQASVKSSFLDEESCFLDISWKVKVRVASPAPAEQMEVGDWWPHDFSLRKLPIFLTLSWKSKWHHQLLLKNRKLAVGEITISCWGGPLFLPCHGRWSLGCPSSCLGSRTQPPAPCPAPGSWNKQRSWSVLRPCHLSKCSIGPMYAVIIPLLSSLASCGTHPMLWLQGKLVRSPPTAVSATARHTIAEETNRMRCNHVQ